MKAIGKSNMKNDSSSIPDLKVFRSVGINPCCSNFNIKNSFKYNFKEYFENLKCLHQLSVKVAQTVEHWQCKAKILSFNPIWAFFFLIGLKI